MTDHSAGRGKGDGTFTYKTLLVAGMHFMDAYNYDINRVKRCVIHYTAPNGLVYPFCTYNSGPCFREKIEKQFSVPLPKNSVRRGVSQHFVRWISEFVRANSEFRRRDFRLPQKGGPCARPFYLGCGMSQEGPRRGPMSVAVGESHRDLEEVQCQ